MSPGLLLAPLLLLLAGIAHPTHTSTAELVERGDSVRVAIRIFADDLAGTADLRGYVAERFGIEKANGEPVPLEWLAAKRSDDVLVVHLRGRIPGGLSGAVIRHAVLMDRFADQVNLVRARYGGGAATLVFIRGDPPKALP